MRRLCDTREAENLDLALSFLDKIGADGELVAAALDGLVKGQEAGAIKPTKETAPYFEKWSKHEREDVRRFGQQLATLWGDPKAVLALMGVVLDEKAEVSKRIEAIRTVRQLKSDQARAGILNIVRHEIAGCAHDRDVARGGGTWRQRPCECHPQSMARVFGASQIRGGRGAREPARLGEPAARWRRGEVGVERRDQPVGHSGQCAPAVRPGRHAQGPCDQAPRPLERVRRRRQSAHRREAESVSRRRAGPRRWENRLHHFLRRLPSIPRRRAAGRAGPHRVGPPEPRCPPGQRDRPEPDHRQWLSELFSSPRRMAAR